MIDIFKEFFQQNPQKILGKIKETTDQYGNPDIMIVGTDEDLEMIDVSPSMMPEKNKEVLEIDPIDLNTDNANSNLAKSITNSEGEKEKEKQVRIKKQKSRKKFSIVREGDDTQELYKGDEAFNVLNPFGFDDQYMSVWVWYCKNNGRPLNEYFDKYTVSPTNAWFETNLKNGNLCYDNESKAYMPSCIYYSGNIYEKIMYVESSATNETYTESQKQLQIKNLKNILPKPLLLTGANDERLVIDVLSKFADTFEISTEEGETKTIREGFKDYLREIENSDLKYGISASRIIDYYIDGDRMPNHMDKIEKADLKRKAGLECSHQMSIYLADIISPKSRTSIELFWNREHNGFVDVNYNKIPLYFEFSKKFKKANLEVRPAQREGVSFNTINGTGIVAYDVGVGKTATAILSVANALQNGLCKRPLFVVPKQTYEKWISEFRGVYNDDDEFVGSGILPQYPIYDLFNLSPKYQSELFTADGHFKGIPEGAISIITYQGLGNIGFSQNVMQDFKDRLIEILNQGFSDASERAKALSDEKVMKILGIGVEGTILNIDDAMFDYMVIDEAHNMNKIFTGVKGEVSEYGKRESTHYKVSGQYSARGVKSFFLSNYIQDNTKFGNICLLTATPFTNNPLEVFNILSLTNYNRLKKFGINNMVSFFDNYIHQTSEKVVTSRGSIEERQVIKGWTNKVSLQKVLFSYMNYKSGEDANIQRPSKWTLPKLSENIDGVNIPLAFEDQVTTYLKPTPEQKIAQKEISEWLIAQMKDKELAAKAPHLVADMKAKKNCISHYVYEDYPTKMLSPKEFINSSPKLKYTVECIKSIIEWHKKDGSELSNQVIYINGAIKYLPIVKKYFLEELGYKTGVHEYGRGKFFDEVEILTGGGGSDDDGDEDVKKLKRTDDEKEDIKNLFNSGKIKIIIGTSTIREGIDLQNRSTALFNLWVDWNPTDYKQLEGRIWRFGNEFKNVRIVTPLVTGSSDAFTYQKLEEKTARINDIFDRNDRSNILDVGEEDREAIKWALIDDLKQIVIAKIKDEVDLLSKQYEAIKDDVDALKTVGSTIESLQENIKDVKDVVNRFWKYAVRAKSKYTPEEISEFDELAKMRFINSLKSQIEEMATEEGYEWSYYSDGHAITSGAWKIKEIKKEREQLERLEKRITDKFNTSIYEDTESIQTKLQLELDAINDKKDLIKSDEYIAEETAKMEVERQKFNSGIDSFEETVEKFIKLNYLLGEKDRIENVPVKAKSKVIEKLPEAVEQKQVVEVSLPKIETIEKINDKPSSSSKDKIQQAIEDFEFLLEMADTDAEKQKIQTAIEDLQFLLDMDL